MIAQLPGDRMPTVQAFQNGIGILVSDAGEQHGFLLDAGQATSTALAMLAAVSKREGDVTFSHPVESIDFKVATPRSGEPEGWFTFTVNGAPFRATINDMQIAEMAAAFTEASKAIDG